MDIILFRGPSGLLPGFVFSVCFSSGIGFRHTFCAKFGLLFHLSSRPPSWATAGLGLFSSGVFRESSGILPGCLKKFFLGATAPGEACLFLCICCIIFFFRESSGALPGFDFQSCFSSGICFGANNNHTLPGS